ncbi:unnamed protein product [Ranitomeya imitator]|uniref:Uncharacterized protein n=1 Tax=Ranitomeya imitator TaxID=111125 RepID=A0ABN9LH73_9NEOB|nr:unnamed protein product [Ranitomeya imitator]
MTTSGLEHFCYIQAIKVLSEAQVERMPNVSPLTSGFARGDDKATERFFEVLVDGAQIAASPMKQSIFQFADTSRMDSVAMETDAVYVVYPDSPCMLRNTLPKSPFSPVNQAGLVRYRYNKRFTNDHDQRYDLAVIVVSAGKLSAGARALAALLPKAVLTLWTPGDVTDIRIFLHLPLGHRSDSPSHYPDTRRVSEPSIVPYVPNPRVGRRVSEPSVTVLQSNRTVPVQLPREDWALAPEFVPRNAGDMVDWIC